jgi:phosphatidylinositol dimannoside acyltransferase
MNGPSLRPPRSEQILDVLRWGHLAVVVPLVPADRPRALKALGSGLTALYRRSFGMRHGPILREEFERCSGGQFDLMSIEALIRGTFAMQVRINLEEAVLPRLGRDGLDRVCRVSGRRHLEAALEGGHGAIMAFLHFGQHWYLPVWCGHHGFTWNQVAAAGRPPEEKWQPSWFGRQVFDARDSWFGALPVQFLPLDSPNRVLVRALQRNELVGIAVDGRIGTRFERVDFLGRTALFSPGALKLSRIAKAPIIPCNTVVDADGYQRVTFCEPLPPLKRGENVGKAVQRMVTVLEQHVLSHPDHYGSWLHHVRRHQGWDDHPFFLDHRDD